MLDLRFVRENLELVEESLRKRGDKLSLENFREMEAERRKILTEVENLKHRRNVVSDQIGELKRKGEDASEIIAEMQDLSRKVKEYDERLKELETAINGTLMLIPNIPHESVPVGNTDQDNEEVFRWGEPRDFSFTPKAHWDLGEELDI
ncbi:MAG: serine--tRNA ligase, partial [Halanaerobiaceae bacterium]|nr:serine--tRNA ligase [Halanaerobiaceae bacterium]